LFLHVLLVQILDGLPIEEQFLGYFFDGRLATTATHEEGEALGIERIVGEPIQPFGLHAPAPPTLDPAQEVVEIDALVATGEIADAPRPLVVARPRRLATDVANHFFRRRRRERTTA
jgi:hypothetical protein